MSTASHFNLHGYRFRLQGPEAIVNGGLAEDFAFFRAEPHPESVPVEMIDADPPYGEIPVVDASVYTPRNVVYRHGSKRYIDFHGRGLGIHDAATGSYTVHSRDPHLLYEAAYLFLLSQSGQFLDRRGLHRLHALAVSIRGRSVLVLLPMGGGKSTLGLALMSHPEVSILSDDSPFIERTGRALAFPLRLGLLPGGEESVPPEHRRVIHRMEFGPKVVVSYKYIAPRVAASAEPGLVLIGRRTSAPDCRIAPASYAQGFRACISNCIIGVGLFQGLEFILRSSPWEILGNMGLGWSRSRTCHNLLRRSHVSIVHLGRDTAGNADAVVRHAQKIFS